MARKALVGLSCIALALGLVGCTWTQTQRDFPPSINRPYSAVQHSHDHVQGHGHSHGVD